MATIQPRDVMPSELVDSSKRSAAITFLLLAPHTSAWKVDVWRGWNYEVRTRGTRKEYDLLRAAGFPTVPVTVPRP
jgi:hypothetical protein